MENVKEVHEEKEALEVDCNLPGHEARTTTAIFERTRKEMAAKTGNVCQVTGEPPAEGGDIQWHHFIVERCLATAVDPRRLHKWIKLVRSIYTAADEWFEARLAAGKSYDDCWTDPYEFTDDMTVNGLGLCQRVHTGKGEGIHYFPLPLWLMWAIGKIGFVFVGKDAVVDDTLKPLAAELQSPTSSVNNSN